MACFSFYWLCWENHLVLLGSLENIFLSSKKFEYWIFYIANKNTSSLISLCNGTERSFYFQKISNTLPFLYSSTLNFHSIGTSWALFLIKSQKWHNHDCLVGKNILLWVHCTKISDNDVENISISYDDAFIHSPSQNI